MLRRNHVNFTHSLDFALNQRSAIEIRQPSSLASLGEGGFLKERALQSKMQPLGVAVYSQNLQISHASPLRPADSEQSCCNVQHMASPLQSAMLTPSRTLMSSTAMSPQLFTSTKLSITTLKTKNRIKQISRKIQPALRCGTTGHGPPAQKAQASTTTHLVGFVGPRQEDAAFPPAVALVAADRPQQDVGLPVDRLLALLDVQRADVRAKHVVPKGHAEVRVRGADHWAQQASHLGLLRIRRQRVDEVSRAACRTAAGITK